MKQFVIAVAHPTPELSTAITNYLKEKGAGWWHWIEGFWLVADSRGSFTAVSIRDYLMSIDPANHTKLVLEIRPVTWGGFGPEEAHQWMNSTWHE